MVAPWLWVVFTMAAALLQAVEILFAQALAWRVFRQSAEWREWVAVTLIVGGVVWLLNG